MHNQTTPQPTVSFRQQIHAGDRPGIERVTRSTGFFSETEVAIALEVFDDALAKPDGDYRCVIAELNGEMCGFSVWGHDEQTVCSYEMYWLVVSQELRGLGIGRLLNEQVEAQIREIGGGLLLVETAGREQYTPTRHFYEKQGYTLGAWLEDYFAPGDARVIYLKRI